MQGAKLFQDGWGSLVSSGGVVNWLVSALAFEFGLIGIGLVWHHGPGFSLHWVGSCVYGLVLFFHWPLLALLLFLLGGHCCCCSGLYLSFILGIHSCLAVGSFFACFFSPLVVLLGLLSVCPPVCLFSLLFPSLFLLRTFCLLTRTSCRKGSRFDSSLFPLEGSGDSSWRFLSRWGYELDVH